MVIYLLLTFLIMSTSWAEDPIRVAVLDTGLDITDKRFTHLCKTGHADLTGTGLRDNIGHSTHVTSLIQHYAEDANYCIFQVKIFDKDFSEESFFRGINHALSAGASIINISAGGNIPSEAEYNLILNNPQATFVVSAGNSGIDLSKYPRYFPAAYGLKNIVTVGSISNTYAISTFSNYGAIVSNWEFGENILGFFITGYIRYSGTSQATAIHTGKMVQKWVK